MKREDIKSILLIGAGPIVIGQGCEFDYSGTQACKALKEEGYRVILVNSNPATIMTDPDLADVTYIEPLTTEFLKKIITKERPDALLPTMGGQTALNLAINLEEEGFLKEQGVELIGADAAVIDRAENRQKFREIMDQAGIESPRSAIATSLESAMEGLKHTGLPAIIRPSFTLGGAGGGIAYNVEEFEQIIREGLAASPTHEVLVEESLIGWKEYEMEVVRDRADNCIIVCSIENIDPMGVHTGDSITVAPALTLTDKEFQRMRDASLTVLRKIGVETGGSNVQFAVNPENGRMVVIEMNPRVSRSSALASKATGFPIAHVAAKLAVGYTLDELKNTVTGSTPISFEPVIDYVVTKIPRFAFEKFPSTPPLLSTSMKSVGEAMAIGRNFAESLQKAFRSLEVGLNGLDPVKGATDNSDEAWMALLSEPRSDRLLACAQAIRAGKSLEQIHQASHIDLWFLRELEKLVKMEKQVEKNGLPKSKHEMRNLKAHGFSDVRLGQLAGVSTEDVKKVRDELGVKPVFKRIDTCAAEFDAHTSYFYSSYEGGLGEPTCESTPSDSEKVVILGSGPNRIGQGVEFDYCCVQAAYAFRKAGYETIMINCNPETVSTDFDTSDRLYFEPLTQEDVLAILETEKSNGKIKGCVVQYGGQTPLKLSAAIENAGYNILGTSPDSIDLAEDRDRFCKILRDLGLRQPNNAIAHSQEEAVRLAEQVGYPLVVRPSYVLGGRAMEIVHDLDGLNRYFDEVLNPSISSLGAGPILLDQYLTNAIETDVDCLCDGTNAQVVGVMEHIEEAGIHSGDSSCSLPPFSLSAKLIEDMRKQTERLALALKVRGLMNVQYAIKDNEIYILEANPRASRTIPFVAKAIGKPVAQIGALLMAGETLDKFDFSSTANSDKQISVKSPVFPFKRFNGVDTILGPEMRSTGEVMGIDDNFAKAFAKAMLAAGHKLPLEGVVFLSLKDGDKAYIAPIAKSLVKLGFTLMATKGTHACLTKEGIEVTPINKVFEGRPNCIDALKSKGIQMVINTASNPRSAKDSFEIRRTALNWDVPHFTTLSAAKAVVKAIAALKADRLETNSLQSYFKHS